jgi:serine/threonine-protein kinase
MKNRILGDRFRLVELIGGGTSTQVYRAEDTQSGEAVAVKVLPSALASMRVQAGRFQREATIATTLNHPFIARGVGQGEERDGTLWIALEWLHGETLRARLDEGRPLAAEEALRMATAVCHALVEAHSWGWVHRDLTPSNVFLCFDGATKLFDFGLASAQSQSGGRRLTRLGSSVGTLHYMAPEQLAGHSDARSDLFALGILLYEAMAGSHPWPASSAVEYIHAVRSKAAPPVNLQSTHWIPPELASLVARLLLMDPAFRPQAASEVLGELVLMSARLR